jgi:hypothetical protein
MSPKQRQLIEDAQEAWPEGFYEILKDDELIGCTSIESAQDPAHVAAAKEMGHVLGTFHPGPATKH